MMRVLFIQHTWFEKSTDLGFFFKNLNDPKLDVDFLSSVLLRFTESSAVEPLDNRFSLDDLRKFCKRYDASIAVSLSIGDILWLRSRGKSVFWIFEISFVVIKLLFRLEGERKYCERLSLSSDSFELRRSILWLLPIPFKPGSFGNKLFRCSYIRRDCTGWDKFVKSSCKIF
jgi:hypothetical protein